MENNSISLQPDTKQESSTVTGNTVTDKQMEQLLRFSDSQLRYICHIDSTLNKINDKLGFIVFITILPFILGLIFLIISVIMGANIFSWFI